MKPDWSDVRSHFEAALEVPPAQRGAWLDEHVGGDTELRRAVDRLLAAEGAEDKFLEPPTLAPVATPRPAPARLGPFRLLEPIGSGGMGTVWRAEQDNPRRHVAVKIVHAGVADDRHGERFRAEVDALARLQHPGIAQVYEAGVEPDGTAWFAMELLRDAAPITDLPRGDLDGTLTVFLAVCEAVQHAHQRGVIHRDLKPANILRLADGAVKVIDFGIALVVDPERTAATRAGELLGTLAYMSPEQVEARDTDVRTDVYSLGVVLYELACGTRPFDLAGMSLTSACRAILEREPTPLGRRTEGVPLELEWIVGKALRKNPAERYASIADFAADVRRVLSHEPVAAAPPSALYRARKFVRRHRVGVAAATMVLAVSIGAFVTTALALVRTQDAEAAERARREEAEESNRRATAALDFLLGLFEKVHPGKEGRDVKMVDALASTAATFDQELEASPSIRAALGRAIGIAFLSLGDLPEAERRLRDSLTLHERVHGPKHQRTTQVLIDLGHLMLQRGKLQEAEELLARADECTAELAPLDPLRISLLMRKIDLLRTRGERPAALVLLEPLVERLRSERPGSSETLLATNLQGGVLMEQGKLDAALPLFSEVVDGFAARNQARHPEALAARSNLLMVRAFRALTAEVLGEIEQLARDRQDVLGRSHPDTIGTLSNLGSLQFRIGQPDEGLHTLREAVASLDERSKDTDRSVRTLISNLARIELDRGDKANAERLTQRVLAARREALGDGHEETLMTVGLLGELYRATERYDEALSELSAGLVLAEAADPPQWPNRYRLLLCSARCHMAKGELALAERELLQCREIFDRAEAANPSKGQLARVEPLLAQLYRAQGEPEKAAEFEAAGK